jgi:hypothetical protein
VLAEAADDRWTTIESGKHFLLELPYRYSNGGGWRPARALAADRGIELTTTQRFVTSVSFTTDEDERWRAVFKKRWGKPRVSGEVWTWYRGDRTITASHEYQRTTVTITRR